MQWAIVKILPPEICLKSYFNCTDVILPLQEPLFRKLDFFQLHGGCRSRRGSKGICANFLGRSPKNRVTRKKDTFTQQAGLRTRKVDKYFRKMMCGHYNTTTLLEIDGINMLSRKNLLVLF